MFLNKSVWIVNLLSIYNFIEIYQNIVNKMAWNVASSIILYVTYIE